MERRGWNGDFDPLRFEVSQPRGPGRGVHPDSVGSRLRHRLAIVVLGRPVLLYDGDCSFCTTCARFVTHRLPTNAEIVPWQFADLAALGTSADRAQRELLWVRPSGRIDGGAGAVAALLVDSGGAWRLVGRLMRLPLLDSIARGLYRLVAANRHRLPGGTPACQLPAPPRSDSGIP
jgi:predicted DCC family thiol-disulfide oxidoreductase YuxK